MNPPPVTELFPAVARLVAHETGYPLSQITPETTLFGDLGVDGDDASFLLATFAREFHVDLAEFQFDRHFGGEGLWPWQIPVLFWRIFRSIRGDEPHDIGGVVPVRVADLVHAAERGRWITSAPTA